MSFLLNTNELLEFLNRNQLNPLYQKESGQCYILLNCQGYEVAVFFVIRPESTLLQLVAYLPFELKENTLSNSARLLHLLNSQLDMPGFGMDEKEKLIFYRGVIPCLEGMVHERLLSIFLGTIRGAVEKFIQVIGLNIAGNLTTEEIIKNHA